MDLMIFDERDTLLCLLSNETEAGLNYWEATFSEQLNNASVFEFSCLPRHEHSGFIREGNQVAFTDKDGYWRLFTISETEMLINAEGEYLFVRCEDAVLELERNVLTDIRPQNVELRVALERALHGQTRWRIGEVAPLGIRSTNFFYISSIQAIGRVLDTWGAELRVRITVQNNRITGRFIDAVSRGVDTGLVLEVGHNVRSLQMTVETGHIRTLMYGRGAGVALYDEQTGEATGGYSRRVMFGDLIASMQTHGFVKPRGQDFLTDETARQLYGLANSTNENREHLEGVFEDGRIEDADLLMRETWAHLQENNHPHYRIKADVLLLAELLGEEFEHERLRLGDVIRLRDEETFSRPIGVETRVVGISYDLTDDTQATVELGNQRNLYARDNAVNEIRSGLNNGSWNRPPVIGPGNMANVRPSIVAGFEASGGFNAIHLLWNHQNLLVRDFELHASVVRGFTANASNLIYRGAVNAFSHQVGANQRFYYRVRAVNHHGEAGAWSAEVSGQTANTRDLDDLQNDLTEAERLLEEWRFTDTVEIDGGAIRANSILANRIVANSITTDRISANAITANLISSNAIQARHLTAGLITADHISAGAIQTNHMTAGSINANRLTANSITTNQIAAGAITANQIATNAITANMITTGVMHGDRIQAGTLNANRLVANSITSAQIAANAITADHISTGQLFAALDRGNQELHIQPEGINFLSNLQNNAPWARISAHVWRFNAMNTNQNNAIQTHAVFGFGQNLGVGGAINQLGVIFNSTPSMSNGRFLVGTANYGATSNLHSSGSNPQMNFSVIGENAGVRGNLQLSSITPQIRPIGVGADIVGIPIRRLVIFESNRPLP